MTCYYISLHSGERHGAKKVHVDEFKGGSLNVLLLYTARTGYGVDAYTENMYFKCVLRHVCIW